jgi:hypothetical protein
MKEMNGAAVTPQMESRSIHRKIGVVGYSLYQADCLEWMDRHTGIRVHAIVTDPPYGLKEYSPDEKRKLRNGRGGVWRIPPSYDGCKRSPVPRFTVLTESDLSGLKAFFVAFAARALKGRALVHCEQSAALASRLFALDECWIREAWGNHATRSNASGR